MEELILILVLVLCALFPVGYIFYKKGSEKFLYVSSVFGAFVVIYLLVMLFLQPLILLDLFFIPQFEYSGYLRNIIWLRNGGYVLSEYFYFIVSLLQIPISIGIFKNYDTFRKNT